MDISSIFFGPDGRLRSGFRFLVFVAVFAIVAGAFVVAATTAFRSIWDPSVSFLISELAILVAAILVGWLCNKYLDKLPFRTLGASFTGDWLKHFGVGLVVGGLTLCVAVLIAFIFGGLSFSTDTVEWNAIGRTLLLSLLVFIVAAAAEEALSRGYPMQTFFHSDLKVFGVVFTSLLFASGHLGNPNSTWLAFTNTFLGGVWFGVAFWKTGDLWFPFGMHLMWNWMQGAFFGIEVSGLTDVTVAPLLKEIDRGPAWLTGEAYGIEAGVACTAALAVSIVVIFFFPFKKPVHFSVNRSDD
jgi:membrane protease YdiL (CAAX protease family)